MADRISCGVKGEFVGGAITNTVAEVGSLSETVGFVSTVGSPSSPCSRGGYSEGGGCCLVFGDGRNDNRWFAMRDKASWSMQSCQQLKDDEIASQRWLVLKERSE